MRWGAAALVASLCAAASAAASPTIVVFPIPGGKVASPRTQIVFRGEPITLIGPIAVFGSRSGEHSGDMVADSDGMGGSFIPKEPFDPGETVTVTTTLPIAGASHGRFRFTVATPAGGVPEKARLTTPRVPGDIARYHSEPGLTPVNVRVTRTSSAAAPGDIFLTPQHGPVQYGPMIINGSGGLVWFKPLPRELVATDFRVQTYEGKPVLTWWQGRIGEGVGNGEDVVVNSNYQQIATVGGANGVHPDLHEFQLTARDTAWVSSIFPVRWNARPVHGLARQAVFDDVLQEIDLKTGLVLFQWDSLDHVPITDSYIQPLGRQPYDYFHLNSIDVDYDGNLVVSGRNVSAAYKLNSHTGTLIWQLGGKHSSFTMGPGARFAFQHDVRVRAPFDQYVTLFDDEGGPPRVHPDSRGLKLMLSLKHHTATVVTQYEHDPGLSSDAEGNVQQLANGDEFVGWGDEPYFSEFSSRGTLLFDAHFADADTSYRAYRYQWVGRPLNRPSVNALRTGHKTITVWASWNGATQVRAWRLVGGSHPDQLRALRTVGHTGFETAIHVSSTARYLAVEALSASGAVLSTSSPVTGHRR